MKAQPKSNYCVIDVPLAQCHGSREAKATNSSVQSVLRTKTSAEVIYWAVPDEKSNVFCRRITMGKIDREKLEEGGDFPDLNDLYDTDLPWFGKVTFEGASRQFRNRHALEVFVQVVKMYDGILYLFAEGGFADNHITPYLIRIDKHKMVASHVKMTFIDDVPAEALQHMFPTKFPKALIDDMRNAGYEWKVDRFISIDESRPYSEILCRTYGKFLQPLNGI